MGLARKSILSSFAKTVIMRNPEFTESSTSEKQQNIEKLVNYAFARRPDLSLLVTTMMNQGISGLDNACQISPGTPFLTMQVCISCIFRVLYLKLF